MKFIDYFYRFVCQRHNMSTVSSPMEAADSREGRSILSSTWRNAVVHSAAWLPSLWLFSSKSPYKSKSLLESSWIWTRPPWSQTCDRLYVVYLPGASLHCSAVFEVTCSLMSTDFLCFLGFLQTAYYGVLEARCDGLLTFLGLQDVREGWGKVSVGGFGS